MSVLTDPGWIVPPLPPDSVGSGGGGMDRLRRAVCRFSTGAEHAERRAAVEQVLAAVEPARLRAAARAMTLSDPAPPVVPRVPLTVLAAALGVADPAAVAALVPPVAAAYHPPANPPANPRPAGDAIGDGTADRVADEAADELLRVGVAAATVLVQSCLPVAALVTAALDRGLEDVLAGPTPPVPATRRWSPATGETIPVPLAGIPFGEGPRRCPGEEHARALAAGVLDALRPADPPADPAPADPAPA
jgi:hypothetical protein